MVTHRYVGIAVGLLMLLWFASGVVMLFVHWPEVTDARRAAALPPINWTACCDFGPIRDEQQVRRAVVEDLAGRPVLRFDGETLDLATGTLVHAVGPAEAARVAAAFARAEGVPAGRVVQRAVQRDQWTVTGYFDRRRPFWANRMGDPGATDIYVSAHTGQVSQVTDRASRILSWLGPIPHWLYPAVLRADTRLWSQVVIWGAILGTFLTVTGLYLGIVSWRPWRDARLTPFRGLMAWHHLGGLAAGVLTLTWVASGLVSMNPWGLLEGRDDPRAEQVGGAFGFGELRVAILAAKAQGLAPRQLTAAPLGGRLFLMADGVRLDAQGRPAPLASADLAAAAARALGPVASARMLAHEDQYWRGHHEPVVLPVYRVIATDGTRFYLDPASARVWKVSDPAQQGYRWLFEGLHRLDFVDGADRGAGWAAAMTLLLSFAGLGVATGVWLGWRRAKADLTRLARGR